MAKDKLLPLGTVIEYVLYTDEEDRENLRKGKIVAYDDHNTKYHVAERLGKGWSSYGFYWVFPGEVRSTIDE